MKKYNDKEVNRLLAAADDLLANIQLYETPEEEQKRKEKEEELRKQEERKKREELRERSTGKTENQPEKEESKQTEDQPEVEVQKQKEDQSEEDVQKQTANHPKENVPKQMKAQPEELSQQIKDQQKEELPPELEGQPDEEMTEEQSLQEEGEQQIDLHQLEMLGEEEAIQRLEAIRRQEAVRQQEEARQLKRMRWMELNGQAETQGIQEEASGSSRVELLTEDRQPEGENQETPENQKEKKPAASDPYKEESRARINQQWEEFTRLREEPEPSEEGNQKSAERTEEESISSIDFEQTKQPDRPWLNLVFIVASMIYLELLTHVGIYQSINTTIIYPILFAAGLGCIITVLASFLPRHWNAIIVCTILILGSLYCDLQLLYHTLEGRFVKLSGLPAALGRMVQDRGSLGQGIMEALPFLLFMFLPILFWIFVGRDWIRLEPGTWLKRLLIFVFGCILTVVSILCLDLHGYEENAPYVCAYRFDSDILLEPAGEQLGMTAMTILELLELMK